MRPRGTRRPAPARNPTAQPPSGACAACLASPWRRRSLVPTFATLPILASARPCERRHCGDYSPWRCLAAHRKMRRMSIVLCGVDDTEAGTAVMTAAKAAAERAGASVVLTHVSTSHWGANVPAFHADAHETPRVI